VLGIDAKITQLDALNDRLMAIGLGGVYEVNEISASPILEEPVRMAYASTDKETLFISTYSDELKMYQPSSNGWIASNALEHLDDRITSIFEGENGELWFLAVNKAYRLA
jgi:hypothetical protein